LTLSDEPWNLLPDEAIKNPAFGNASRMTIFSTTGLSDQPHGRAFARALMAAAFPRGVDSITGTRL
jgi:hypothetical protein